MSEIEQVARYIFYKLGLAVIYLHEEAGIIHRDIKLDNILFDSNHSEVKLSDFTVSRGEIGPNTKLFDCEGTPSFTAPECTVVEKEGYFPKPTDMWSIGVCIYTFIAGIVPFYGDCEL
jgi:serine/threonine protein kinase